jgi:rhodanese-related sulfurtransferase
VDTAASSFSIAPSELRALLGRPDAPVLLDARRAERFAESPWLLPAAVREAAGAPGTAVAYCVHGHEVSQQAAAQLRAQGWQARYLEGGIEAWREAGGLAIRKRPDLGVTGEQPSRWITRERPKIDRVACPWLIRRFIDPRAEFFYVPTAQVFGEAQRLGAVPYDIPGAPISHAWERCSFDALIEAFELKDAALQALAAIVRGADTDRLSIAPQSAGLLALSLGLSRLHAQDDAAMLEAAMPMYDALYAWCAQAQGETHTWRAHPEGAPE